MLKRSVSFCSSYVPFLERIASDLGSMTCSSQSMLTKCSYKQIYVFQVASHPYHHPSIPVSVPVSETSPNEVPSPPHRRAQHPGMTSQAKDRRPSSSPMQLLGK